MQIYLKIKFGITIISVMIITYIISYDNGFYQKSTIKEWSGLKWSDFEGVVKHLNIHDVSLHVEIYIKYDSLNKKYLAFAGQNNKLSWKRKSVKNDSLLLRHEQYHFNITEYFARKMNETMDKMVINNDEDFKHELKVIREKSWTMQESYDDDTNHSLNRKNQTIWESKIDSLLK